MNEILGFSSKKYQEKFGKKEKILGLLSLTILKNFLCLVLQISLYSETFECNTTIDWLTHTV